MHRSAASRLLPLIPQRRCGACQTPHDVLRMTLAGRQWLCAKCLHPDTGKKRGAVASSEATRGVHDATGSISASAASLRRIDFVLSASGFVLRTGAYIALVLAAQKSEVWAQVLTGVLIADVATWGIAAWFELHLHRFRLALELALYLTVGHLWLDAVGTLALPEDTAGKAVVMFGFGIVFSIKIALFVYKVTLGDRE